MAKFDWIAFLNRYRVPYNTRGPNTPRNAVTVHCPFCGAADPSDHMVVWGTRWRCWRDHSHGGTHPAKLVQALIRCSSLEAQRITAEVSVASPGDLSVVAKMLSTKPVPTTVRSPKLPPEFRPFKKEWACEPFIAYLRKRGFKGNASYLHWRFDLHYCTRGPFKGRIIFPVVVGGKLISWTGRTIYPAEELRYKSLTTDPETAAKAGMEPAVAPINRHFLWQDWLSDKLLHKDASTFVLVEGPFDALKINVLGEPVVVSTCWTGSEPTAAQIELLHRLVRPFKTRVVISDSDMPHKARRIAARLKSLDFHAIELPAGIDDPAEIKSYAQLMQILHG